MNWDKLRIFYAVANAGSFTRAAEDLHVAQSSVSRQINALEYSLGIPLFHRHARGLILTEQGDSLFQVTKHVAESLHNVEDSLDATKNSPTGVLRVHTTASFGISWLTEQLREFYELYPQILVSLHLEEAEPNLNLAEVDCAIRLRPPKHADLVQTRLTRLSFRAFASKEYLKKHGTPEKIEDLDQHKLIGFNEDYPAPTEEVNWLLWTGRSKSNPRSPVFQVNSHAAIYRAISSGIGIGPLSSAMLPSNRQIEQVLPDLVGFTTSAWLVYTEAAKKKKRIQVFRDFLISRCAELRTREEQQSEISTAVNSNIKGELTDHNVKLSNIENNLTGKKVSNDA